MCVDCRLELDASIELDAKDAGNYQSLTVVLRWIVDLGRMGMCLEADIMASCSALPRDEQL